MEARLYTGKEPDAGRAGGSASVAVGHQRAWPMVERRRIAHERRLSEVRVRPHGAGFVAGNTATLLVCFMNRRMPNGTSGGVGGRREQSRILPDPSLHGKVDLVPGHPNFIRLEASDSGDFIGQCAEYCGKQHANMHILVVSQEPAAFEKWLAGQRKPGAAPVTSEAVLGQQAFLAGPCTQCHTVRGTPAAGLTGPDLSHIGSRKYFNEW